MTIQHFNIIELIPQRPPMLMIDRLVAIDVAIATTNLFIHSNNIFCKNGYFTEPGLIENIAQTAAAKLGYHNKINAKKIVIGYIAAIKNLNIYFLPKVNTEIQTEIFVDNEVLGFTIIKGSIFLKNKIVADCEMKIFIQQ